MSTKSGVSAATAPRGAQGPAPAAAIRGASAHLRSRAEPDAFPEIRCVRGRLPRTVVAEAEDRAERLGVGADRVLVARGRLDEETYIEALCDALGSTFERLHDVPRKRCPLDDRRLIECGAVGMLPLATDDGLEIVVAPRGTAVRRILQLASEKPDWPKRFRFTTTGDLDRFVLRCAGEALLERACERLKKEKPIFSAAAAYGRARFAPLTLLAVVALALAVAPAATALAVELALAVLFLAWLGLRLSGALVQATKPAPLDYAADADLPVYTVIVALYREAASVEGLLHAIERLDYPALGSKCTKAIMAI